MEKLLLYRSWARLPHAVVKQQIEMLVGAYKNELWAEYSAAVEESAKAEKKERGQLWTR